ncbi:Maf family protein [Pectinatus haikarae]|uniref:dTTP/UTP pyrophosphatase n=1 Tax=Pectinatus haikarae TaxID=349096 RepID=A0ABT9YAG1_9FIRM|nr:Maf family protein [Pectinatus haikarae]MDQ0204828.1 septum formation protein [Pectinatus haikarae]
MIILASASPRRRELLTQIGCEFIFEPSETEEVKTGSPKKLVCENALLKAGQIAATHKDMWVIGADTVVAIGEEVYGKPADEADAISMLRKLSGRSHQVYTGIALVYNDKYWQDFSVTEVEMAVLTEKEIERYAASGESLDKAGSYAIQGKSAVFIKKIDGSYSNVVGLPLHKLYALCKKAGCNLIEEN